MKRSVMILPAAALLLTACERGAPEAPVAETKAAQSLAGQIAALPPGQLNIVLFRAIRDAGHPCQGIAASRRIDDQNGRPAWSAQCDNRGGNFLLVLSPTGLMNVTKGDAGARP